MLSVLFASCRLLSLVFVCSLVFAFICGCQWLYNQVLLGRKFYFFWKSEMIIKSDRWNYEKGVGSYCSAWGEECAS